MKDFLQSVAQGKQAYQWAQELAGKSLGLLAGPVTDNDDPSGQGRVKVALPGKGGYSETDWLFRVVPFSGLSTPVPLVGDTVLVGYLDGDSHKGIYLGSVQNVLNPAAGAKELHITLGDMEISIRNGVISITGVRSFTLEGKEVAVVTAPDSRGDRLVQRGY